jgi:hypothetical protein
VAYFIAAYLVGATSLALWIDLRFPGLRPTGWPRMGAAVAAAMVGDDLCTPALGHGPRVVGVIGVVLPALAFTLLVSLWLLRMMRAAMPT